MEMKQNCIDGEKNQITFDSSDQWQIKCGGLSDRLDMMRKRNLWTDCTVTVGPDHSSFQTHRVILASASPVLAAMLFGPMSDSSNSLHLPNVEYDTFQLLLGYMYTDNICIKTCDEACSVYKAANYLMVPQAQAICKAFLIDNVSPKSLWMVYELGKLFDDNEILEPCIKLMEAASMQVLEVIEGASADTVAMMFALPSLAILSEMDLVRAADCWLKARYNYTVSTVPKSEENKTNTSNNEKENIKTVIKPILQNVRFLTLEKEEFANCEILSSLLEESELLALSLNLLSSESYLPMPAGFSDSTDLRGEDKAIIRNIEVHSDEWKSDDLAILDLLWGLSLYDNSFYIKLTSYWEETSSWACEATFQLKVFAHKKGVKNFYERRYTKFLSDLGTAQKFKFDVDWEFLIETENGYVYVGEDGVEVIKVELRVSSCLLF